MDKVASERGRKSAEEFQKLLVLTSMGGLALFFSVLTKTVVPELTQIQQIASISAVLTLASASGLGILNWYLDAKINLIWSFALKEEDKRKKSDLYKQRNKMKSLEKKLNIAFFSSYAFGMSLAIVFLILRILDK